MKRHKRKQNSLVLFCALHFLVYTLLLVGVYGLFQYLVNERMNAAFFSIDDLLQYQEALEREDYGAIPAKNVSFLIFDDEGHTVYASNRTIGEKVFFEDLDMLDDYHSGKLLDVFQSQTADGSVEYTVYLSTYAEAGKAPKLLSSCVLDEDYNILRGDLFAGRQALTQREFNLLCGISKTNSMAEKYTYETTTGEGRTLVFFATRMGEREYDQSLRWANSLWLAGVPCILHTFVGAARALGARAIHLPLPVLRTLSAGERAAFPALGASCHSVEEAWEAVALGATYLTAGHVFATTCKAGLPGRGVEFLAQVCAAVPCPVYAIGGVGPENLPALARAGAKGGCVRSPLMTCPDPGAYLRQWKEAAAHVL